ncbi:hypothetical protein TBLA_0B03150 [Henningerozyma blattae CBS 6284]|uniref:Rrn9 domain-containing protein n=1 Tax=Henningerozyma blattae (strain ATCC 34711 / CBS 6284 / DSM 70876 / NBRC 10599 / NRRL Y-10934 / UCD 77-7) TaxID=1071380 RepID=I2GYF4_HENB6|nr:hypothetical protein TBLA_0B03150 [Tetrapisispora blattae CBS 6284]CCH59156.1 hypothetical protein TBLA_0B03150 [Tetrapisispora blattae CBS 6284]
MTSQLEDGVDSQSTITEKELRNLIKEANEILNLFETNHQTDLATHLYSTFLLKNLLRRSNRKKYPQEIDAYIKSNIKDSWTSWPNKKNIIDPMTDSVYQDHLLVERPFKNAFLKPNIQDIKSTNSSSDEQLPMKHVSVEALEHGKDMLALELNSWWQKLILKNSSKHITSPDINLLNIPDDINSRIFDKLDKLFENLNNNFVISRKKNSYENPVRQYLDKLNTLDVIQNNTLKKIENDYLRKSSLGKSLSYANNAPMNITFQDIINMGCQMNEDMTNIYKKSLKLYQDLPIEFKKNHLNYQRRF